MGKTNCKGCLYYRSLSNRKYVHDCVCHYCIDTGKLRGIPPADCYRHAGTPYTPRGRKRKGEGRGCQDDEI